jgi:hypothetical protein
MANFTKISQLSTPKLSTPKTKPANDEKTTLIASRALVISRKSVAIELMESVFAVAFKAY